MAQKLQQLEVRLALVEKELLELRTTLARKKAQPWYRQIVGDFAQDSAMAEILRLGQQIRRGNLKG